MRPYIYRLAGTLISAVFAASGFSSPLDSKLLPLVPPGAEVVAGFNNHPPGHHTSGRLLLTTHNDRVDLDDWQSLSGVDSKRIVNEVIEVAASSQTGKLTDHLLLVAGRFDTERIFKSAELNGALRTTVEGGVTAMVIKPFAREQGEMKDTRWLVILKNQTAMLGTREMVHSALRRYEVHSDIDMALMERLSQMRRDVTSWTILVGSATTEASLVITQPNSVLTRLIEGVEMLTIGTRFGSKIRVDFSLHVRSDRKNAALAEKMTSLEDVFSKEALAAASSSQQPQRRFGKLSLEPNGIEGSVELSAKDFNRWNELGGFARRLQDSAGHGE